MTSTFSLQSMEMQDSNRGRRDESAQNRSDEAASIRGMTWMVGVAQRRKEIGQEGRMEDA